MEAVGNTAIDDSTTVVRAMEAIDDSTTETVVHLLQIDAEVLGKMFEHLKIFEDRLRFRAVCQELRRIAAEPSRWKRLVMADPEQTKNALQLPSKILSESAFPRAGVEALALRVSLPVPIMRKYGVPLFMLAKFPRLIELDISNSTLGSVGMLRAAFETCAATLHRLNISGVRCIHYHGGASMPYQNSTDEELVSWEGDDNPVWTMAGARGQLLSNLDWAKRREISGHRTKSIGWFGELASAFEPLKALRVLHARDVCRPSSSRELDFPGASQIVLGVQKHCPCLEELVLGWRSEFHSFRRNEHGRKSYAPDLEVLFNRCTACVAFVLVSTGLPCLRVLTLAGNTLLDGQAFYELCARCPCLATVDLCGCRRLTDDGLSVALPLIARSLESLNVRGTGFGDQTALALAKAGADLLQLNASCTALTGRGLAAISEASTRLRTLDLCYAQCVRLVQDPGPLLATFAKHGGTLRMLGLGGFDRMNAIMLRRILGLCPGLEHLGIGGCSGLNDDGRDEGDAADHVLSALPNLCPSLTALNAHRLPGSVSPHALKRLLEGLPALTALDVHGTDFSSPLITKGNSTPCGEGADALMRWLHLGGPNPGEFFDGGRATPFISRDDGCVLTEQVQAGLDRIEARRGRAMAGASPVALQ